jgi:hypothetical protein
MGDTIKEDETDSAFKRGYAREMRNAYTILVGKHEWEESLG